MIQSLKFFYFAFLIFFLTTACSENRNLKPLDPAGLGPEGVQIRPVIKSTGDESNPSPAARKLKMVLATGQRAVAWLNLVNSHRDQINRLNLADKTTKNPVPPEKPNVSSVPLILEKHTARINDLPPEMKSFLLETPELVEVPPVADDLFIKHIREINSSYQQALRWLGHEPYFAEYAQQSVFDIRGYYFLTKEIDLNSQLVNFENLDAVKKNNYENWLTGLCHNSQIELVECGKQLKTSITQKQVPGFYSKYFPQAQTTYQNFFSARAIRSDLKWDAHRTQLTQDFINPTISKVATWLQLNIEDEWKALNFQLNIHFVPQNDFSPFVQFVPGVTPHVSGDNYQSITMDPDYSLDDYSTQWTIRHEFGHVLGFPDCYLEFYDEAAETMTYYTIEPDNLMCAWGGKLQPSHVEQLQKVY